MSAAHITHFLTTTSDAKSFCEPLVDVPAYRSISHLSTSLNPRTVSRERMIRLAVVDKFRKAFVASTVLFPFELMYPSCVDDVACFLAFLATEAV